MPDLPGLLAQVERVASKHGLATDLAGKIIDRSPFETIDKPGVGWRVRLGAWVGRDANPALKLGICREHGRDPASIGLFHAAGTGYVSWSPLGIPIARVAATQAILSDDQIEYARRG